MTYENLGQMALDYFPCRYGKSKLLFRGPRRDLQGEYVTYLGGIETYGKFVEMPFPMMVEHQTGIKSVNLGCANAGIDAYVMDNSLIDICKHAKATVIQVMGAQNMSNRFYAVHARRNDRLIRASGLLQSVFEDVDFAEFNFTGHLLGTLSRIAPDRFEMVEEELKCAWVARMLSLIEQIDGKVVLLWLADHPPEARIDITAHGAAPLFVDRAMIEVLVPVVSDVVEVVATPEDQAKGLDEMIFGAMERPAAQEVLGPVVHRHVSDALVPILKNLM